MNEVFINVSADGKITNKSVLTDAFKLKEGRYKVRIDKASRRSLTQNAYFHGPLLDAVVHCLREAGYSEVQDKEDAKMIVKLKFLVRSFVNQETGEALEYILDTHKLDKEPMGELIELVIQWLAEYFSFAMPPPGEQLTMPYFIASPIPDSTALLISK